MPIHYNEPNVNKIIPYVYLGNYIAAQCKRFINDHKIKGIINVTPDFPNTHKNIK